MKLIVATLLAFLATTSHAETFCEKAAASHEQFDASPDELDASQKEERHLTATAFDDQCKAERAKVAKINHEVAARKAMPGVKLGMTEQQVRDHTSWGAPERVHRTSTALGVREQWVYGGTNYLYFTNGVLTGIQN